MSLAVVTGLTPGVPATAAPRVPPAPRAPRQVWVWTNTSLAVPDSPGPHRQWVQHPRVLVAPAHPGVQQPDGSSGAGGECAGGEGEGGGGEGGGGDGGGGAGGGGEGGRGEECAAPPSDDADERRGRLRVPAVSLAPFMADEGVVVADAPTAAQAAAARAIHDGYTAHGFVHVTGFGARVGPATLLSPPLVQPRPISPDLARSPPPSQASPPSSPRAPSRPPAGCSHCPRRFASALDLVGSALNLIRSALDVVGPPLDLLVSPRGVLLSISSYLQVKLRELARFASGSTMGYAPLASETTNFSRPPDRKEAFGVRSPRAHDNDFRGTPVGFEAAALELWGVIEQAAQRYALALGTPACGSITRPADRRRRERPDEMVSASHAFGLRLGEQRSRSAWSRTTSNARCGASTCARAASTTTPASRPPRRGRRRTRTRTRTRAAPCASASTATLAPSHFCCSRATRAETACRRAHRRPRPSTLAWPCARGPEAVPDFVAGARAAGDRRRQRGR